MTFNRRSEIDKIRNVNIKKSGEKDREWINDRVDGNVMNCIREKLAVTDLDLNLKFKI